MRPLLGAAKDVLVAGLVWLLWQLPIYAFLDLPPRLAMLWLTAVAAFFLWCHAVPHGWSTPRSRATARVRAIPASAAPWLAVLAPAMVAGALATWMLVTSLGLAHDVPLPRPIVEYGERPGGALVLLVLIAGLAPLIEEFAFRGWMQRPLERRFGPAAAIIATALLFALAHLEPGGIPIRALGGAALGYVVWATGSIWAGVILHVCWNAGVLAFGQTFPSFDPATHARAAAPATVAILACAAVFAWAGPRLRRASLKRALST